MNPKTLGAVVVSILTAAAISFGAGVRAAAPATHQHEQSATAHTLKLNADQKWATDGPLRQGMTRIRDAVEPGVPAAHGGKLTTAQYDALGTDVLIDRADP